MSENNLGWVAVNSTVRFKFTTHAASGAAVAPSTAFEAADLDVYKDGSSTPRSSANGITMTSPFNSTTGLHHVDMDLSDNTDAGFYAAGSVYEVVLTPDETVDSLTVVKVVARFTIGVQPANTTQIAGSTVSTTTAQLGVNVVQISTDATAADNAEAFFDGTGYAGTGNTIPTVTSVTNQVTANATAISGDSVAADNLESWFDGTGYDASTSKVGTASAIGTGGIAAASFAAGAIDASAIAADAIGASELAAGAVDEILDDTIGDGTLTVRQALRVLVAAHAAKLSGAATTTVTIRNVADSQDVIVATVDSDGNRTAVTVTP